MGYALYAGGPGRALYYRGCNVYSGEENKGFLAGYFSFAAAQYALSLHTVIAYGFVLVIVVHVSAALVHDFFFRENIILSMITGRKEEFRRVCGSSQSAGATESGTLCTARGPFVALRTRRLDIDVVQYHFDIGFRVCSRYRLSG